MPLSQINPNKLARNLLRSNTPKHPLTDEKSPILTTSTTNNNLVPDTDDESLRVLAGSSKYSLDYGSASIINDDISTRVSIRPIEESKKPFGKTFKRVYKKIFKKQNTKPLIIDVQDILKNNRQMDLKIPINKGDFTYRGQLPDFKGSSTTTVARISIFAAFINTTDLPSLPSLVAITCLEELLGRLLIL